jgi:hypothetical protein
MSRLAEPNKLLGGRAEPINVPVTTVDAFCARTGLTPDWLLMDIEGFEFAALFGARRTLERLRKKIGLVVEMHPDVWKSAGTSRADAERFLYRNLLEHRQADRGADVHVWCVIPAGRPSRQEVI